MADLVVKLGDFTFQNAEVPQHIPFGGEQRLAVHRMVGGGRVIDAMGRDDAPLQWSGLFRGSLAVQRARYLDGLRVAGKPLTLTWHQFRYTVLIRSFVPVFARFYEVPYSITCEVVEDLTKPVTSNGALGADSIIGKQLAAIQNLANLIADSPLIQAVTQAATALSQIPGLSGVSQKILQTVVYPIQNAQERVGVLVDTTNSVLQAGSVLGGVISSGTSGATSFSASLNSQTNAMQQMGYLQDIQGQIGGMLSNLGALSNGSNTIVAGGSLFDVAAQQYGDATAWTGIARANGLVDTAISGIQTLQIPALPDNGGGVLNT